jgi:hypothetical protein
MDGQARWQVKRQYVHWARSLSSDWHHVPAETARARRSAKVAIHRAARQAGVSIDIQGQEGFSFRFRVKEVVR